ncbi:tRNA cyclic N6-threonylcarbamoyladenosine(37) synthase TcdA [Candidatus Erwinia haradaeae]|uniref:tRNA threonylcarbamoyladenosine dehydratase n=1 Tax=Candidatus Erwinia haradaeae TaxID=1922217 RepID=A0A451D974_9GAMM|nr:tRNA cyclic N6-threonylcarbamoyladenosine(37) synthase TcdA [Candidatus Erwinia haradaeae]VFP82772.1 tRNA threonylcarbamoyladenosine dehydratase [Candidatus Erwinia haradaeae]
MKILSAAWEKRFSGVSRVYGQLALPLFSQKHICIVGIGGVGSWVAEALTRSGIGMLTLIDMDDICITNTNRQIHTMHTSIGHSKNTVMAARIRDINPECHVNCIDDFLTLQNIDTLLNHNFNYVVDAIDDVGVKAALVSWCYYNHVPLVTIGGSGGKIDPMKIQVSDLSKTVHDPLSAALRRRLRDRFQITKNKNGNLNIDCVFSAEPMLYPQTDGSVCISRDKTHTLEHLDCEQGLGSVTMVTASFGLIASSHILKETLKKNM